MDVALKKYEDIHQTCSVREYLLLKMYTSEKRCVKGNGGNMGSQHHLIDIPSLNITRFKAVNLVGAISAKQSYKESCKNYKEINIHLEL